MPKNRAVSQCGLATLPLPIRCSPLYPFIYLPETYPTLAGFQIADESGLARHAHRKVLAFPAVGLRPEEGEIDGGAEGQFRHGQIDEVDA